MPEFDHISDVHFFGEIIETAENSYSLNLNLNKHQYVYDYFVYRIGLLNNNTSDFINKNVENIANDYYLLENLNSPSTTSQEIQILSIQIKL